MTKQIISLASQVLENLEDITADLEAQLDALTGTRYTDYRGDVWEIESIDVDYIDVIKYTPDAMENLTTFTIEITKHEKITCITGSNANGDREYDSLKVFPKEIQTAIYKAIPLAAEMNRATLVSYALDIEGLEDIEAWSEADEALTMEKAEAYKSHADALKDLNTLDCPVKLVPLIIALDNRFAELRTKSDEQFKANDPEGFKCYMRKELKENTFISVSKADCVETFHTFEIIGNKNVCFIRAVNGVEHLCYECSYDSDKFYWNGEIILKESFDSNVLELIDLVKYCYNIVG